MTFAKRKFKWLLREPLTYGANEVGEATNPDWPRYLRITDLNDNGTLRDDTYKTLASELAAPYLLEDGDLLFARSGATSGKAFLYRSKHGAACFAGYLIRAKIDLRHAFPQFLYYFSQSDLYWRQISEATIQATIQNVSAEKYASLEVPLPPLATQRRIAAYLDRETSEIDRLIAAKERLLTLLGEKRRALITHAVTHGTNTSVKSVYSGVEWIGEIPQGWRIVRGKQILVERDERSEDGQEELLTVSHITGVTARTEKDVTMFEAVSKEGYKICRTGDLAVNTMWAFMGALGVAKIDGIVSPSYTVYVPSADVDPDYLDMLVRIPNFCEEIRRNSKGVWSSRLRLYAESLFDLRFPLPPVIEQRQIVKKVEGDLRIANLLESACRRSLTLIHERRSALIAAAVTGQISIEDDE